MSIILSALIVTTSFAQNAEDTTDWRFHDDLLNHLVGKWDLSGIVHGNKFKLVLEAEWSLNHRGCEFMKKVRRMFLELMCPMKHGSL